MTRKEIKEDILILLVLAFMMLMLYLNRWINYGI